MNQSIDKNADQSIDFSFEVTEGAYNKIHSLLLDKNGAFFRVSILGGGCSGFQYNFQIDDQKLPDDKILTNGVSTILIDSMSVSLLNNSTLDYVITLGSESFEVRNPNASAQCGCGNSFST